MARPGCSDLGFRGESEESVMQEKTLARATQSRALISAGPSEGFDSVQDPIRLHD